MKVKLAFLMIFTLVLCSCNSSNMTSTSETNELKLNDIFGYNDLNFNDVKTIVLIYSDTGQFETRYNIDQDEYFSDFLMLAQTSTYEQTSEPVVGNYSSIILKTDSKEYFVNFNIIRSNDKFYSCDNSTEFWTLAENYINSL